MDDDDISISPYEAGTWEWDDTTNGLEFRSDKNSDIFTGEVMPIARITGSLEFSDNSDLLNQLRFQRHYQRPMDDDDDVVTLQDITDVVLFSAPKALLTIPLINILHSPTTERLIRALIFYCQYYMQVTDILTNRSSEKKLRSNNTEKLETGLREDLEDLRFLVAKEYCYMILSEVFDKHTHIDPKKHRYATASDVTLYETCFRFIIQIVWISLGRESIRNIEVEVSRLFKSDKFNLAEHKYNFQATLGSEKSGKQLSMSGDCVRRDRMLQTRSPLNNEIFCKRSIAHSISGVGVIKYPKLTPRLKYFERVLILPEKELRSTGVSVGILGLSRKLFDPMLKAMKDRRLTKQSISLYRIRRMSRASVSTSAPATLIPYIVLPEREIGHKFEDEFPCDMHPLKSINMEQKRKWIQKVHSRVQRKGRN